MTRSETSVLAVLEKLRANPMFSRVMLRRWDERPALAQVWVEFSPALDADFQGRFGPRYARQKDPDIIDLKERTTTEMVEDLLVEHGGASALTDVELHPGDYMDEELRLPAGALLVFRLAPAKNSKRSSRSSLQRLPKTREAGGVVLPSFLPPRSAIDYDETSPEPPLPEFKGKGKPGYFQKSASSVVHWPMWFPNPSAAEILKIADAHWRRSCKTLEQLAAKLNKAKLSPMYSSRKFSRVTARSVVIAVELLRGNPEPII